MSEAIQQMLADGVSAHPIGTDQVIIVVDRRGVVFERSDLELLFTALRKGSEETSPGPVLAQALIIEPEYALNSRAVARAPIGALRKAHLVGTAKRERAKAVAPEQPAASPVGGDRDWAGIEQVVRSVGVTAASTRYGVPYHTIYTRATKEGWIKPKGNAGRTLISREGVGVEAGMKRRCHQCNQITTENPCSHCEAAA